MAGCFSFHEFYMKYFIQILLSHSLSFLVYTLSWVLYIVSSVRLYLFVSLWYRRGLILPRRVIVSQRSSFLPPRFDGRMSERASERTTRYLCSVYSADLFPPRCKINDHTWRTGTRKEGEPARGSGDSGNRGTSRGGILRSLEGERGRRAENDSELKRGHLANDAERIHLPSDIEKTVVYNMERQSGRCRTRRWRCWVNDSH